MSEIVKLHTFNASIVDSLDLSVESRRFKFEPLYSGGPAYIDGFDAPAYVDLSMLSIDPDPKALLGHDPEAVVGRLENIVNDGERITCDAVIGGTTLARKVIEFADNVANWSASIGVYRFDETRDVEFVPQGATANVNNRKAIGPCYIVHGGSLAEGSFVAIGGDGAARSLAANIKKGSNMSFLNKFRAAEGEKTNDDEEKKVVDAELVDDEKKDGAATCEGETDDVIEVEAIVADAIEEAVEEIGEEVDAAVVEEIAEEVATEIVDEADAVTASVKATKLVKAKLAEIKSKKVAANLAEGRRVAAIRALCGENSKVAAAAISGGWSLKRTERVLDASNRKINYVAGLQNVGFGGANTSNGVSRQNIVAAAFAKTLGLDDKRAEKAFGRQAVDAATAKPFRDMTFKGVVAASLNSYAPGSYDVYTSSATGWSDCKAECLRAKMNAGGAFRAGADFSTISATDVFQLVLQAFLEPSEDTAPRLYSQITRENKLTDFNSVSSYLPTIQGRLQKISETGAIQNVGFTTAEFTRSADPYAAIFTIPEKTIINDQIDTFAELLRQLETLGDDCVEHDVAETFWRLVDGDIKGADGNALVSASVGNYITGGTLDEDGLAKAIAALNSFSTANGVPIASDNLTLLAGSALAPAALKLAHAGYVDFQNGTAYPNVFQGRFKPLEWAYLDSAHARALKDDASTASVFAGDKTWILLRDPQRRPAVCVNKIVGFESPRVEQFNADPSVWGTTYRYVYPYGVSVQYKDAIVATTNS